MSDVEFRLELGQVDFLKLETDEDFRREARRLLPTALTQIGERIAEYTWSELQKSFRGIPGFAPNSSSGDKHKFIRDGGRNYARDVSSGDRAKTEETIISRLRQQKQRSAATAKEGADNVITS